MERIPGYTDIECPRCGQRAGEYSGRNDIDDYFKDEVGEVVYFRCRQCGHEWKKEHPG